MHTFQIRMSRKAIWVRHYPSPSALFTHSYNLEAVDSVLVGKYTIGLGQKGMAVALDNEDVVSMCMTGILVVSMANLSALA